eukprot:TRINITY_DN4755_c0_g1_i2.p1 TRINITY_DN4755_c0_g1~~TRINITY_DN4755_c0_g1_i2.p1  ORF type:complete len:281 (+),score=21.97 TRINITY_DN4755_c0_g1_i2:177-1019(+)
MSSSSGLTFKLHPLVIVNISDHYTRLKAQNKGFPSRVIGCVIGQQVGRMVEIFNSFELKYAVSEDSILLDAGDENNGTTSGPSDLKDSKDVILDRDFLLTKIEQYKKVFPNYDILGWYSTGSDVEDSDMNIHKALMDINESPIYVVLNPLINPARKDLPISIYESELHVIDGVPSLIFVKSNYTIETVEAERISVDHVAHIKPSDGSSVSTQLAAHLTGMHSAIKMLNSRIRVLHNLLISMHQGAVPYDHSLLRQVSSLVRRLPAIDSPRFQEDFQTFGK